MSIAKITKDKHKKKIDNCDLKKSRIKLVVN